MCPGVTGAQHHSTHTHFMLHPGTPLKRVATSTLPHPAGVPRCGWCSTPATAATDLRQTEQQERRCTTFPRKARPSDIPPPTQPFSSLRPPPLIADAPLAAMMQAPVGRKGRTVVLLSCTMLVHGGESCSRGRCIRKLTSRAPTGMLLLIMTCSCAQAGRTPPARTPLLTNPAPLCLVQGLR